MSHSIIIKPTVEDLVLKTLVSELNKLDKIRAVYQTCSDAYILTVAKLTHSPITDDIHIMIGAVIGNHIHTKDIIQISKISNKSARDKVSTLIELLSNTEPQ
jgi:phosphate/sulfate permease